ncbi:APC family permease [Facilibium subflavum]|uniref:APC family permease n=1 Tax=Facilibium subflavum TaxID=2219058 RepID=UPI001F2F2458|nr:APC family permease [Facilibium subflavum]
MKARNISITGLLFSSISAILGSGWLFSAAHTASFAGPASILSWIIGACLIMIIAFVFAEICTMVPVTGSSTRIPHITHGTMVSFIFAWIIWLSYLTLAPTEVQAIIQYLAVFFPQFVNSTSGALTAKGMVLAAAILLLVSILNTYSLRWLIKANNFLTIIKIIVPLVVAISVMCFVYAMYKVNTSTIQHLQFAPNGSAGVLSAISLGGIAFSFTGFKLAAEMAGETKNPKKAIPIAIIGSIVTCLIIFLLLQFSYLYAVSGHVSSNNWYNVTLNGGGKEESFGPFAMIAQALHAPWLMVFIYIGAIAGPLAAGLMYFGSATRSIYAMSQNNYIPRFFAVLTPKGNPIYCIIVNFVVGLCMFAPLPGWSTMATFLTSLVALTYIMGPVSASTFRKKVPDMDRPFRLPVARIWMIAAFYASTLIVYWSGWNIVSKTGVMIAVAIIVLTAYCFFKKDKTTKVDWHIRQSYWLWGYLVLLSIVSYLGDYGGGIGMLNNFNAMALLLVICIISHYAAVKLSLPKQSIVDSLQQIAIEGKPKTIEQY